MKKITSIILIIFLNIRVYGDGLLGVGFGKQLILILNFGKTLKKQKNGKINLRISLS